MRLALRGMVALMLVAPLAPRSVWERMATMRHATSTESLEQVDGAEGSARERYEIWQVAKRIIKEHPITGVGIGVYKPNHEAYAWREEFSPIARGGRDTHSLYLNVTAETGFPGIALYMTMVISLLVFSERVRRRCKIYHEQGAREILQLQAGYIAFMMGCVFGSLPYLQHWLLHMALLFAVSELHRRHVDELFRQGLIPGMPEGGMRGLLRYARGGEPMTVTPTRGRRGAGIASQAGRAGHTALIVGPNVVGRTA
jgi:O-antigen ligase